MKKIRFGNILDVNYGIIVHGCNSHGVMGSGIAAQIKHKWQHVFADYYTFIKQCEKENKSPLGQSVVVQADAGLIIVNGITQGNFGRDGKRYVNYEALQKVFHTVAELAYATGMPVHYPLIGAGLGGGDWSIISEIIECELSKPSSNFSNPLDIDRTLWIYEP